MNLDSLVSASNRGNISTEDKDLIWDVLRGAIATVQEGVARGRRPISTTAIHDIPELLTIAEDLPNHLRALYIAHNKLRLGLDLTEDQVELLRRQRSVRIDAQHIRLGGLPSWSRQSSSYPVWTPPSPEVAETPPRSSNASTPQLTGAIFDVPDASTITPHIAAHARELSIAMLAAESHARTHFLTDEWVAVAEAIGGCGDLTVADLKPPLFWTCAKVSALIQLRSMLRVDIDTVEACLKSLLLAIQQLLPRGKSSANSIKQTGLAVPGGDDDSEAAITLGGEP